MQAEAASKRPTTIPVALKPLDLDGRFIVEYFPADATAHDLNLFVADRFGTNMGVLYAGKPVPDDGRSITSILSKGGESFGIFPRPSRDDYLKFLAEKQKRLHAKAELETASFEHDRPLKRIADTESEPEVAAASAALAELTISPKQSLGGRVLNRLTTRINKQGKKKSQNRRRSALRIKSRSKSGRKKKLNKEQQSIYIELFSKHR